MGFVDLPLNSRGPTTLAGRAAVPDQARAVLALVHGLGEHAGRYAGFAAAANARGIAVVAGDLRGHGRSPGVAGYVERFGEYVDDADAIIAAARAAVPGRPWFVMGHSMGGAVVIDWLVRAAAAAGDDGPAGVVLSSAALRIGPDVSPWLLRLAPLISAVLPGLRVNPIDPELISRVPAQVAAYADDPLVMHVAPPARTAAELLSAIDRNTAALPRLKFALYAMHGTDDRLTDPQGSRDLHTAWGGSDKTLRLWSDSRHEVLNDRDGEAARDDLLDWIDARA